MKSMKTKAQEWISSLFDHNSINDKETKFLDCSFYFKLDGFADNPEVYLRATLKGLEFGYEATQWDGYLPSPKPGVYKKHLLKWETLQTLNTEQEQEIILDLLMKTIKSRKRQYQKCQFCGEKIAVEHRIDKKTCHGCASEQLGVVY